MKKLVFKLINLKNLFIFLILVLLLIFSSCNNNSTNSKIDRDGDGLDITFNTKLDDETKSSIYYEIVLKNTGLEEISLKRDKNFILNVDLLNINDVFSKDQIDNFYNNIFGGKESIKLYNNFNSEKITGFLELNPNYFNDLSNEQLTLSLITSYNYKTDIFQNVEVDLENNKLKFYEKLSQAAPVELYNVDLKLLDRQNKKYRLEFFFRNKNLGSFNKLSQIKFNSINLKFGTKELNDCNILKTLPSGKIKYFSFSEISSLDLTDDVNKFTIICDISFDNFQGNFNTQISGSLTYNHKIIIKNTINLPEYKNNDFDY